MKNAKTIASKTAKVMLSASLALGVCFPTFGSIAFADETEIEPEETVLVETDDATPIIEDDETLIVEVEETIIEDESEDVVDSAIFTMMATEEVAETSNSVTTEAELLDALNAAAESNGTVTLDADISLSHPINISSTNNWNITIDGNGHTLYKPAGDASIITVSGAKTLTFKNITLNGQGKYGDGAAFYAYQSSTINLENATVVNMNTGNTASGCEIAADATLNLYSGGFKDSRSDVGPAVVIRRGGTFNMYGGVIDNCKGGSVGAVTIADRVGNRSLYSEFNMYSGTISNCTGTWNFAGALYVEGNNMTANLYAGTFSHNSAVYGGAILALGGAVNIGSSLIVTQNTASDSGGGVCTQTADLTIADGAKIYENTAPWGSDVTWFGGGTFNLGEAANGTTLSCGGHVDGWYWDAAGDDEAWQEHTMNGLCNVNAGEEDYVEAFATGSYTDDNEYFLKAAHGNTITVIYTDENPQLAVDGDIIDDDTEPGFEDQITIHINMNEEKPAWVGADPEKENREFVGWLPVSMTTFALNDMSDDNLVDKYQAVWTLLSNTDDEDYTPVIDEPNDPEVPKDEFTEDDTLERSIVPITDPVREVKTLTEIPQNSTVNEENTPQGNAMLQTGDDLGTFMLILLVMISAGASTAVAARRRMNH